MVTLSRRTLLGSLASLAAAPALGSALEPAQEPAQAPSPAAATPAPVFLQETRVAGTWHHKARGILASLHVGQPLVLRREPENPHDALAIEVLTAEGVKLGYVPRQRNPPFARLMDAGQPVRATLAAITPPNHYELLRMNLFLG